MIIGLMLEQDKMGAWVFYGKRSDHDGLSWKLKSIGCTWLDPFGPLKENK